MNKGKIITLLVVVIVCGLMQTVYAAEEAQIDSKAYLNKWLAITAGFALAIAAAGGAYAQGKAIHAALEGTARNPGSADLIRFLLILGLAFIESLVIYTLVISLILVLTKWV